jgi:predicted CopG family antitoxin
MTTTIQISDELLEALKKRKIHAKETYEEIIWDLLEDQMVLKDEIIEKIEKGRQEYLKGEYQTLEDVFGKKEEI